MIRSVTSFSVGSFPVAELFLQKSLKNLSIPIYGKGDNVRDWIFVTDHCNGIMKALLKSKSGEIYNFGGDCELSNIDLVKIILEKLEKKTVEIFKDFSH